MIPRRSSLPKHAIGGFTLLEVLVAGSLSAALAGLLLLSANRLLGAWAEASDRTFARGRGVAALDRIVSDLEAALPGPPGTVWLSVAAEPAGTSGPLEGARLRLVALRPVPEGVGYRLVRFPDGTADSGYQLCRASAEAGLPGLEAAGTPIAAGIAGFEVRVLRQAGTVSELELSDSPLETVAVEIVLHVLTGEGGRRLRALDAGRLGSRPAAFASDAAWRAAIASSHSVAVTRTGLIAASR